MHPGGICITISADGMMCGLSNQAGLQQVAIKRDVGCLEKLFPTLNRYTIIPESF